MKKLKLYEICVESWINRKENLYGYVKFER